MKHKATRRKFIKGVGLGTIATGLFPGTLMANTEKKQENEFEGEENSQSPLASKNYSGEYLNRIAFPLVVWVPECFVLKEQAPYRTCRFAINLMYLTSLLCLLPWRLKELLTVQRL